MALKLKNTNFIKKSPVSINDIDINEIVASNKFLCGNQDFKYYIGYKDSETIRPLCIFHPQMIIYKRKFGENTRIYFLIKKENAFIKYVEVLWKVRNIIKNKFNSELIYSKKYLKVEKNINSKRGFQCLYAPVLLIDSIYRKDENYYPKVFLEKYCFTENIENLCSNSEEEYYDEECINLILETLKI